MRPDLRTRGGYQWPWPGQVAACDPNALVPANRDACPSQEGDGLCVATTWRGMASGGIPASAMLLVAYASSEALGGDTENGKLRLPRVAVVAVVDGLRLLRESGAGANLTGADLYGADLARANLYGANLTGANLTRANLYGANLTGANLTGANLTGADLTGADLTDADLTDADLTRAALTRADLTDAKLTSANLRHANLAGANLTRADLTGANLTGADLTDADLTSIGGNVEEKQCESSDCPVVLYTGEECPVCGR